MEPTRVILLTLALTAGLPLAAHAEGPVPLARDPSCKPVAAVQFLDCQLDLIYRCDPVAGAKDHVFRDEFYVEGGMRSVSYSTADGWQFADLDAEGVYQMLVDPTQADVTPGAELVATGKGHFKAQGLFIMGENRGPVSFDATVTATGQTVTLSGLAATEMEVAVDAVFPPPVGPYTSLAKAYYLPDLDYSIEGESLSGTNYDPAATPHRPMSVTRPGAEGFVTTKPAFCGTNMG